MSRVGVLLLLSGCATPQAAVVAPPPSPPPPAAACPTTAPAAAAFGPEGVFGARVEKVCLLGAGDETSLRLREAVAPREGAMLDAVGVRSDLTALVDTGLINQGAAFAEPSGPNAVVLTYVVVERALIASVRVEGGASLPADVRQQLEGKGFRDTLTQRHQRRDLARDWYGSQGFHDATIDFQTRQTASGTELLISITEGPRFIVDAVRFDGAKAVKVKDLEQVIETKQGAPVLPERVDADVLRLTGVYLDRGHVMASVTHKQEARSGAPGPTAVVFTIVEGPVFRVGDVSMKGLSFGTNTLAGLETKKGAVFSRAAVKRDLERLSERARKQGRQVVVVPLTEFDQTKHTVGLTFEVTEER